MSVYTMRFPVFPLINFLLYTISLLVKLDGAEINGIGSIGMIHAVLPTLAATYC